MGRFNARLAAGVTLFLSLICTAYLYSNAIGIKKFKTATKGIDEKKEKNIVLIYYPPFGDHRVRNVRPEICGSDINCEVSYDRNTFGKAGAVVFHYLETPNPSKVPKRRHPGQLYAWWTSETIYQQPLKEFDGVFNLTFTYRTNSDIYAPYNGLQAMLYNMRKANSPSQNELLDSKSNDKVAIWFVSNCRNTRRLAIAQDLVDNGVKVDRYGKCFGGSHINRGLNMHKEIYKYKFYLAFENAYHCKDYITEKLWENGYWSGAVPIYWGASKDDVAKMAPAHSYIHVEDFKTTKELAEHIKYLLRNDTAYAEYLQWRNWINHPELIDKHFVEENINYGQEGFCRLCRLLHNRNVEKKLGKTTRRYVVKSLDDFWNKGENEECIDTLHWT